MRKLIAFICFLFCSLLLFSCNLGGKGQNNQTPFSSEMTMGHVNAIPYSFNSTDYVLLPIKNNTNNTAYLSSIKLTNSGNTLPTYNYLDSTNCISVPANGSCYLKIFAKNLTNYQIKATYKLPKNNQVELTQMVNFSDSLPEQDNMIVSKYDTWINDKSDLSIPVLLHTSYGRLEAILDDSNLTIKCSQPRTSTENMCTILVPASFSTKQVNQITLNLYSNSTQSQSLQATTIIQLSKNLSANLIFSAINPTINPANGNSPQTITLLNNGAATATNIRVLGITPILIQNNTCSSLAVGQTCTFQVNANSSTSGQSSVSVTYQNSSGNTIINSLNVVYISQAATPLLTLTASNDFLNTVINQGSFTTQVTVQNSGDTNIQNLQINSLNLVNSFMDSFVSGTTCVNGQTLYVGSSCQVVISYAPTSTQSGSVKFIATGNYYNRAGQIQTYANSSLNILYSAVSGATFKAAGDFGMVMTSPAGAAGTWTANVDSPFANSSISANSLNVSNGLFVMTLSNGDIKYSSLNGLFWKPSPIGGGAVLNPMTCGIAFDGTYFYTCGRVSTAFASTCTQTGKGCIIRTNNLTGGWTPIFTPSASVDIDDIFYFTTGVNNAYIATIANTTANTGFAYSTNGSTWNPGDSGQTSGINNNFSPAVFNDDINRISIWNNKGLSSSQYITSISSVWSAGTHAPPPVNITAALYESGNYLLTSDTGSIYTSTSPDGPTYTQVYSGSTQLNKIILAHQLNGGTYYAVGNNGVNLIATSVNGPWTAQPTIVTGQSTTPNLTGLYTNESQIWLSGVSTFQKSVDANTWFTPGIQNMVKSGTNYIAVGNQSKIFYSPDGNNWSEQVTSNTEVLNNIYCYAESNCLAVGNNGRIMKTTNGSTWSILTSGTTANLYGLFCNSGTCVAVGGTGSNNSGTILVSTNYTNWTVKTSTLATTRLNSVTYYNGNYLAVGNSGSVFSSSSGSNWSSVSSGTAQNLNRIRCKTNVGCIAVGNAGTIIYSAFGSSWSAATSGTTNDLMGVTYNGVFVAVGKSGTIRYSSTGTGTWTGATFPTTSSATNNLNCVIND